MDEGEREQSLQHKAQPFIVMYIREIEKQADRHQYTQPQSRVHSSALSLSNGLRQLSWLVMYVCFFFLFYFLWPTTKLTAMVWILFMSSNSSWAYKIYTNAHSYKILCINISVYTYVSVCTYICTRILQSSTLRT